MAGVEVAKAVLIKQWRVVPYGKPEDFPPGAKPLCLRGKVFGHPTVPDGEETTTSVIKSFNQKTGLVKCVSRCYQLGIVDSVLPAWFRRLRF